MEFQIAKTLPLARVALGPILLGFVLWSFAGVTSAALDPFYGSSKWQTEDFASLAALLGASNSPSERLFHRAAPDSVQIRQGRLAINGDLSVELPPGQFADSLVLEFDDPQQDSIYALSVFQDEHLLGSLRFAASGVMRKGVWAIQNGRIGLQSDSSFNRLQLSEIHGRGLGDPEFLGGIRFGRATKGFTARKSNLAAYACQLPLAVAYNAAFAVGLVAIDPITAAAAGAAGYTANMALKFCKTVLEAPIDLELFVGPGQCFKPMSQPHMVSEYQNALGVPLKYEYNWGDLGTPGVYHHNTEVEVTLQYLWPKAPDLGSLNFSELLNSDNQRVASEQVYDQCDDKFGSVRLSQFEDAGPEYECPFVSNRELQIPVGSNTLVWRSNVKIGVLDIVSPIIPGIPASPKVPAYQTIMLRIVREIGLIAEDFFLGGWRVGNVQTALQSVTVFDEVPPTITPAPTNPTGITATMSGGIISVQIEADEPGGVSQRRYESILKKMYAVTDACGRPTTFSAQYPQEALRSFWPVSTTEQDNSFVLTWTARDPGPNPQWERNEEQTTMQVEVVDIRPPAIVPPPDIVEVTTTQVSDLGQPLVFDFVDLDPVITNDAILPLGLGLHEVTWTATDASGNVAQAVQVVNIKSANQDPAALAQTGPGAQSAVSFEPTTIRLEGDDPDADPLNFYIERYPQNGFFVAPLYPYFVEDYRIERSRDDSDLLDECNDGSGSADRRFELKFPSEPTFITVADDGTSYVVDEGSIKCDTVPAPTGSLERQRRIAIFPPEFDPDADDEPVARPIGDAKHNDVIVDQVNELIYATTENSTGASTVRVYDFDLNIIETYNLRNMRDRATGTCTNFGSDNFCEINNAISAVIDANGILNVMDEDGRIYGLEAVREPSGPVVFIDYVSNDVTGGASAYPASSLALDSQGFLYASRNNRIYKYSQSTIDANGLPVPGVFQGWMGRCDIDLAPGDAAVCDVVNHRSLGYACTDDICIIDDDATQGEKDFCGFTFSNLGNFGCRTGQFYQPRGIDIDARDTLYVADAANERIQRFTADGFFSGEAESVCDGSCFVLGDFGNPQDVSVNSDHFYVLDPATNLLHVSQLTPFTELGADYAELVYQSNNDFACPLSSDCIDEFSFSVSDGVRHPDTGLPVRSMPAFVEVEVARNFRAPVATPGITSVVTEDVETAIVLDGSELDPLDELTFNLIVPPEHGSVIIVGDEANYLSDLNYVGEDQFQFAAFDGFSESAPETVAVTVLNANDAPVVSDLEDQTVAVGFTFELRHDFSDPDTNDIHLLSVNWGDGTIEPEGQTDAMGNATGPQLEETDQGLGRITADHVYTSPGPRTLDICVTDQVSVDGEGNKTPTSASLVDCEQALITVIDGVDIALTSVASSPTAVPGQILSYGFQVLNQQPSVGAGRSASGVSLAIDLATEFDPTTISLNSSSCSLDARRVDCAVGNLAPGEAFSVTVTAEVPITVARGSILRSNAVAQLNEEDQTPGNSLLQSTPVVRPADYIVGASGDALKDEDDSNPGDGSCASIDGVCTLRAAIQEANATPGQQVISLGNGVYSLNAGRLDTLTDDLIILGNSPDQTIIDAAGSNSVLSTNAIALRMEDLAISGASGSTAIVASGEFTARRVRFTNNSSQFTFGGALLVDGVMDLRDVTFDGNSSSNDGGALWAGANSSGSMVNVTVVGNSGGGLAFNGGSYTLNHVTITGNSGGSGFIEPAGSLNVYGADVTLSNSILAGNRSTSVRPNCGVFDGGSLQSDGYNLLGDLAECDLTPGPSDIVTDDAQLLPAQSAPGEVPTVSPKLGSSAIDNGGADSCAATDARGVIRPQDGNGNGVPECDIGAVEVNFDALFESNFESAIERGSN